MNQCWDLDCILVRSDYGYGDLQNTGVSMKCGDLAMEESNATCGKRLASIGLANTESNWQACCQLLVTSPGFGEYISGAVLFKETLYQPIKDGKTIVNCLNARGIVPGIKGLVT